MGEIVVALIQALCIVGLLFGAYWSITYNAAQGEPRAAPPKDEDYDALSTHVWHVTTRPLHHGHH